MDDNKKFCETHNGDNLYIGTIKDYKNGVMKVKMTSDWTVKYQKARCTYITDYNEEKTLSIPERNVYNNQSIYKYDDEYIVATDENLAKSLFCKLIDGYIESLNISIGSLIEERYEMNNYINKFFQKEFHN